MLTKTLTTEELAGTTVVRVEEKGGPEGRAKSGRTRTKDEKGVVVGHGHAAKGRRVAKCGEWIRLGDAAADVVEGVDHSTTSRRRGAGA